MSKTSPSTSTDLAAATATLPADMAHHAATAVTEARAIADAAHEKYTATRRSLVDAIRTAENCELQGDELLEYFVCLRRRLLPVPHPGDEHYDELSPMHRWIELEIERLRRRDFYSKTEPAWLLVHFVHYARFSEDEVVQFVSRLPRAPFAERLVEYVRGELGELPGEQNGLAAIHLPIRTPRVVVDHRGDSQVVGAVDGIALGTEILALTSAALDDQRRQQAAAIAAKEAAEAARLEAEQRERDRRREELRRALSDPATCDEVREILGVGAVAGESE